MTHTLIVPGVGGSESAHWQSWLQRQLMSCSRVQQADWNQPVLEDWIAQFVKTAAPIQDDLQIVAHSFGCLTAAAALARHPQLSSRVRNLLLVAPANPARFGNAGFARSSRNDYAAYFHQLKINAPAAMIISENDPWLAFDDAQRLAQSWQLQPVNLGLAGHINTASGYGPFPEIFDYLMPEKKPQHISAADERKYLFKFAI
ncbi:alpha/beta hydrolase [Acinetobacter sp. WCHAc010034]|uniref:RBBP9/YdeN family alpha/beta hydrolase n=1 Tax=Acinetobacter sp. WCHAc010034 TaxID=1879049 RepID=UPI00083B0D4F|nr:alpha/beta hydrolase [Acinetobacter sp. WCHAc010034]AYA04379.1 alpha/beta hydrolase [Acinetobacter sp. WCHAc010034]